MDKIPLITFFTIGYLISRAIIKVNIPQRVVIHFLSRDSISLTRILIYLTFFSTSLSFVIPNAVTVLALLPVATALIEYLAKRFPEDKHIPSIFALSIIYGSNIGGIGSLTGTPANGIMIAFLEANSIPMTTSISYAGWMLWGIPTVLLFLICSVVLLILFFRTYRSKYSKLNMDFIEEPTKHHKEDFVKMIAIGYFIYCFILSLLQNRFPDLLWVWNGIAIAVIGLFLFYLFVYKFTVPGKTERNRLLQISDCYSNLPITGLVLVGVVLLLGVASYYLGLGEFLKSYLAEHMPRAENLFLFYFILALLATFATEFLSNTLVQVVFFSLIITFAETMKLPIIPAFVVITLSSTCAFMSPLATGVNGLAFGGIKGVHLDKMIYSGIILNVLGALMISALGAFILA